MYPRFLKKLDHYLLTHYPVVWKSRIHVFGFFSLIIGNVLALFAGSLYPISKTNVLTVSGYTSLQVFTVVLLAFIGLAYILLQRRFPLEQVSVWRRVLIIPLYAICFTSVVMNVSVFQHTLVSRIANVVPDADFKEDARLGLQIQMYMEDIDNFVQHNINGEKLKELGLAYGFSGVELNLEEPSSGYIPAMQLESTLSSIASAKYYKDHYDLEGFLNSTEYEYGKQEFMTPLLTFAKMRGNFWNASIFMIGFLSLITFLTTYFDAKGVLALMFGLFVAWFFTIFTLSTFIGMRTLIGGVGTALTAIFLLGAIPILWRSKTKLRSWVSGFVLVLMFFLGYYIYSNGFHAGYYHHSIIQVLVMECLFIGLLGYIAILLKKEQQPQKQ